MEGLKSSLRQLCILAHSEREMVMTTQQISPLLFCFQPQCLASSTWPWGAYQRVRAPSILQDLLALQDPSSITPMAIGEIPNISNSSASIRGYLHNLRGRGNQWSPSLARGWVASQDPLRTPPNPSQVSYHLLRCNLTCRKIVNARLLRSQATVRWPFRSPGHQSP
jgi:hypothetical protein